MSLIKFNNRNQLFPWNNNGLKNFLSTDEFFNDDFFEEDSLMPAMNVKEHNDDFEIEFAAPGFTKKDFEVTIDGDILHVNGEKSKESEEKEEELNEWGMIIGAVAFVIFIFGIGTYELIEWCQTSARCGR